MKFRKLLCLSLCGLLMGSLGCNSGSLKLDSVNLMQGYSSANINAQEFSTDFCLNLTDFSLELFKKAANGKDNPFVSPLSVMFALAMTANGANGDTLAEFEQVLGADMDTLNNQLFALKNGLTSADKSKLAINNAIWFRDGFEPKAEFLQTNADYYQAAAYRAAFDQTTVNDINKWTAYNTDNMIKKIVERIDPDHMMFLINAIVFDAEWSTKFEKNSAKKGDFNNLDGTKSTADFLTSTEQKYIYTDEVEGFIKPYHGGNYSFAALLPRHQNAQEYLGGLDAQTLQALLKNPLQTNVDIALPKFTAEFKLELSAILKQMGLTQAFAPFSADFSSINDQNELYISEVLHKTFVSVDEAGTKAAAVTSVGMKATSIAPENPKVTLDRPFIYVIMDNKTNTPIFLGVLTDCN